MLETSKQLLAQKAQEIFKRILVLAEKIPYPKEVLLKNIFIFITGTMTISLIFKIVTLFLPATGVFYQNNSAFVARHLYRIGDAFFLSQTAPEKSATQTLKKSYAPLTAWSVTALFSEGDIGFIVVLIAGQTHFINIGEIHDGYKLVKIEDKQAILMRDGKEFALSLAVSDQDIVSDTSVEPEKEEIDVAKLEEGVVLRKDINAFMSDPKKIWDNIKIRPYKEQDKLAGFLVRYVKKASVFDHLGLKSGDVIISANGITFTSIQQAQDLYANMDTIDNVSLSVRRQGKIKELTYEIQ